MKTTHIIKMQCGVTAEMELDEESGQMSIQWDPGPPFKGKLFEQIKAEYRPWRDQILADWSKRTGKKMMLIEM